MAKLAEELKNNTLAWLRNLHPELLPAGPEWSDPCGRRLESHAGTEGASTATSQK
jgi:hypothetical protein